MEQQQKLEHVLAARKLVEEVLTAQLDLASRMLDALADLQSVEFSEQREAMDRAAVQRQDHPADDQIEVRL